MIFKTDHSQGKSEKDCSNTKGLKHLEIERRKAVGEDL
jgi:hypothetical protein